MTSTTGAPGKSRVNALSILFSCVLEGQGFSSPNITEFTTQKSSKPTQSLRVAESAAVWSLHSYCASYFHVLPFFYITLTFYLTLRIFPHLIAAQRRHLA